MMPLPTHIGSGLGATHMTNVKGIAIVGKDGRHRQKMVKVR